MFKYEKVYYTVQLVGEVFKNIFYKEDFLMKTFKVEHIQFSYIYKIIFVLTNACYSIHNFDISHLLIGLFTLH